MITIVKSNLMSMHAGADAGNVDVVRLALTSPSSGDWD